MSSFGDHDRSRYTLMPPDRGMLDPNSSITKAPQVDIAPATTHRMSDRPGLPVNLKIDAGVENILISVSNHQGPLKEYYQPCTDNFVNDQRNSSPDSNLALLQDMCLFDLKTRTGCIVAGRGIRGICFGWSTKKYGTQSTYAYFELNQDLSW